VIRVGYIAGEPTASRVPQLDRIAEHPDIELTVVYAAGSIQRREWALEYVHDPIVLRGPSLPLDRLLHHDYPITPGIWGLLERERFDVLVIGGWSVFAAEAAIAWARLRKVPYLLFSENHLREQRRLWVRTVKSIVLRQVVPPASGWLVTGSLAREHALHYGARPDRITVFPNTVDVAAYRAVAERLRERRAEIRWELAIPDESLAILQVARLIRVKGVDESLEAVARARALTPRALHLVAAGEGELRPELERRAAELELPMTFAGFRQGEALLECYAAADVFVLLSRRETWGIVVNEAAAFGLPLVLSDAVGAAADLLRPGENGELVRSGDIEGQARAIAKLADDQRLRERYGRRSAELVEPWGYEESVEAFVAAVRQALDDATRRTSRATARD
jgi:glycosyltransferase involved in cell wall biosynthesis